MWNEALAGVKKHLITYSKESHFTVLAERPAGVEGHLHPKMDHLVCFMPGTIALSVTGGLTLAEARKLPSWGKQQEEDLELARELTKTCMGMYRVTTTGLAPEIAHFEIYDPPKMMRQEILQSKSDLELVENAAWKKDFVIKGDEVYREWGWEMFDAFTKHTMVENGGGFTSVNDVNQVPPPSRDNMESFWLVSKSRFSS
jgi:endoplasmic reticulum Man9GlcNAc2 1,2-alpha-mannosidase